MPVKAVNSVESKDDFRYVAMKSVAAMSAAALIIFIAVPMSISGASAKCEFCEGGAEQNWDPTGFLSDAFGERITMNSSNETTPAASNNYPSKGIMISVSDAARSDAIIEPSKEEPETMMTIQDSIAIPAEMLIQNGSLKKAEDMAKVLGDAGVSSEDSVAIYSTNPYDSALMFWALSYLGQKEVAIMNGGVGEWQAAGFDVGRHAMDRPREEYTPALRTQLLAGRNDAFSVGVHLIDCRPFLRFSENRIEGAFSIPSERVIERDRIAPKDALNRSFDAIPKKGPIVVFSEDPRDAAVVWTALQLMGIKSAIYIMEGNAKEQGVGIKNQSFDSSIGSVGRFKKLG